ncbi:hypothetical protein [Stieleria mannarensis]|uniref:hypothetical protein n=1 Tax=Stieleria mannarensis TaxID=2755585 RepID=UPI001600F59C|nr:hypothetical protein [Rhodopirellula sp. JC639]
MNGQLSAESRSRLNRFGYFLQFLVAPLLALAFMLVLHAKAAGRAGAEIAQVGYSVLSNHVIPDDVEDSKPSDAARQVRIDRLRSTWRTIIGSSEGKFGAVSEDKDGAQQKWVETITERSIRHIVLSRQGVIIVFMTILPFLVFGISLSGDEEQYRRSQQLEDHKSGIVQVFVNRGYGKRFILALIVAYSASLHVCPDGRAASTVEDFISVHSATENSTYAQFLHPQNSDIAPVLAGLLGWYVHLLMTFFYRAVRRDVVSTSILTLMVQRFFLVLGLSMAVRMTLVGATGQLTGSVLLLFIAGVFPTDAVRLLTTYVNKSLPTVDEPTPLTELEVIPFGKVSRLAEEGIHDVVDLAAIDLQRMAMLTTIPIADLERWVDRAKLAKVVGAKVYAKLHPHCATASYLCEHLHDEDFRAKLTELEFHRVDEIARQLGCTS